MQKNNFSVILFKDNKKKKILKTFVTEQKANEFYEKKLKESSSVEFNVNYENGKKCDYKICLTSKTCELDTIYYTDDLGRNKSINPKISENLYIKKIKVFKKEEKIYDVLKNKKITLNDFVKNYLSGAGIKLISKINNKIIVQDDDKNFIFSLKNEDDCGRFLSTIENGVNNKGFIIVKDISNAQRKYLYDLFVNYGFKISFLYRKSTTHPK